ncbi:MAG: hypothetical protein ACRC4W_03000 [Treponemataceae bacterium]
MSDYIKREFPDIKKIKNFTFWKIYIPNLCIQLSILAKKAVRLVLKKVFRL